ncbi:DUF4190 domain-containing protein [Microcella humidisoli]|jgi:peptidyl-prolyl cis-trans isomerase B (cyclophilin B)|uniref:DUF4190 domain-containing protein n=1 Tax=Microcella humidisoli TaxID=2963406 RepID=A0ABY5FSZ4_9MICO|nr:DUF4190 domain-containing protein [Microcella humidisoli]UTT61404.1 DUF4190 domain-containing protein [Microcella humidisoli]
MSDVTPPPPAQPAPTPYASAPTGAKTNTLAIVSLVLAFFISLGAVICGHIALSQIKKTGENGRGLAIAGLVLGYLGLVAGLIGTILWISFFAIAAGSGSFSY